MLPAREAPPNPEPPIALLERFAWTMVVCSDFRIPIDDARDQVAWRMGWVSWRHMLWCKGCARRG